MTNHDDLAGLLPLLAAGEVRGVEERRLRRHVDGCEECRSWLRTYSLLSESLAASEPESSHLSSDQLARLATDRELLAASELEPMEQHLAACQECQELLELSIEALTGGRRERRAAAAAAWLWLARVGTPYRVAAAIGLILAFAVTFSILRPPVPDATRDRTLIGESLSGTQVIEAAASLTATAVTVESGGDVTFRAGETVILGNGFAVDTGASFKAEVVEVAELGSVHGSGAPGSG